MVVKATQQQVYQKEQHFSKLCVFNIKLSNPQKRFKKPVPLFLGRSYTRNTLMVTTATRTSPNKRTPSMTPLRTSGLAQRTSFFNHCHTRSTSMMSWEYPTTR